ADKQGQGYLAMIEQPSATAAFNEAFGTKLSDTELQQSVLQSLERETQKGREYEKTNQQNASFTSDEGLRNQSTEGSPGRAATGAEQDQSGVGRNQREQQPSSLSSEDNGPLSGSLFAHTPFSVAHLALNRLNKFY